MKKILLVAFCLISFFRPFAQIPTTYQQFQVITSVADLQNVILNTPRTQPLYLALAPGDYQLSSTLTIDRDAPVYLHGLSTKGTILRGRTNFSGLSIINVVKTPKFSIAGLSITPPLSSTTYPGNAWKTKAIDFSGSTSNDFEMQEVNHSALIEINAAGSYRIQSIWGIYSSRLMNNLFVVNHPQADVILDHCSFWGNQLDTYHTTANPRIGDNGLPLPNPLTPTQIQNRLDSTYFVWQKQGRVRIYSPQNVIMSSRYEFKFESKSVLGPHVVAGLKTESELSMPQQSPAPQGSRNYKAVVGVSGNDTEIIFKANSMSRPGTWWDQTVQDVAFVDFDSPNGKAWILGNTCTQFYGKIINSNIPLQNAQIVLLGNKIASIETNSVPVPTNMYADVSFTGMGKLTSMGNISRLKTMPSTTTYPFYNEETSLAAVYLEETDSLMNAPEIPIDVVPDALTLPTFNLTYNPANPTDPSTNHELLWRKILINVQNSPYNAIPNDGIDDYAAIQLAIDTAAVKNGLVYFPAGQYDISQTLAFNNTTYPPPNSVSPNSFGNTNIIYGNIANTGLDMRSILITGEGSTNTIINGLNSSVLSIFSITNNNFSRIQGLTLKINNSNLVPIYGITTQTNPSQAIVTLDAFRPIESATQTFLDHRIGRVSGNLNSDAVISIRNWSFRDCNFEGGQIGVSSMIRAGLPQATIRSPFNGQNVAGYFSTVTGSSGYPPSVCWTEGNQVPTGLGEMFSITYCKFKNNTVGFMNGHHQALCQFIKNCTFQGDSVGAMHGNARVQQILKDPYCNGGANLAFYNTQFDNLYLDFLHKWGVQSMNHYFNGCNFKTRRNIHHYGAPAYGFSSEKFDVDFVENSIFEFDNASTASSRVHPPFGSVPNPPHHNGSPNFDWSFLEIGNSGLFVLNSDVTKSTFLKYNYTTPQSSGFGNPVYMPPGFGYGFIVQSQIPGTKSSLQNVQFVNYGTKFNYGASAGNGFNINTAAPWNDCNGYIFPQRLSLNPPTGMTIHIPKEVAFLDNTSTPSTNPTSAQTDRYYWRAGNTIEGGSRQCLYHYGLYYQRVLLYNPKEYPCPTALTLPSSTYDVNRTTIVKKVNSGSGTINASNLIEGNAKVTYEGKSILLEPGFKATNGTVFKAQVGGCN